MGEIRVCLSMYIFFDGAFLGGILAECILIKTFNEMTIDGKIVKLLNPIIVPSSFEKLIPQHRNPKCLQSQTIDCRDTRQC